MPKLRKLIDGKRARLDKFEQEFAKDDNLAIIIVPKDGEVFTPRTLSASGH